MRILCLGDSTMQYNDCATYPQTGWPQMLPLFLSGGTEILNFAKNGRSTRSFLSEGLFDEVLRSVRPGDYALIEFGHNDEKSADPRRFTSPEEGGDFRRNLELFAVNLMARKCRPVLLSPVARRKFADSFGIHDGTADDLLSKIHSAQAQGASSVEDSDRLERLRSQLHELWQRAGMLRRVSPTHGAYQAAVRETARRIGVPFIDMTALSEEFLSEVGEEKSRRLYMNFGAGEYVNYPGGRSDNTHLRPDGAFEFARIAAMEMARLGGVWEDYAELSSAVAGRDLGPSGDDGSVADEAAMFR